MSALPPKADIDGRDRHVSLVPKLDLAGPLSRASAAIVRRPGPAPEQLPEPIVMIGCAPAAIGGRKMENAVKSFEPSIDHFIRMIGSGIEIFGVLVIVIGIVWSTYRQLRQPISEQDADVYKIRIGRSLLLGLEVLVAADIVKTIAHELSVMSLGLLAGLVLVCTFLSWTLVLEIEGRWPWQREPSLMSSRARLGGNSERGKIWRAVASGSNAGVTARRFVAEPRNSYEPSRRALIKRRR